MITETRSLVVGEVLWRCVDADGVWCELARKAFDPIDRDDRLSRAAHRERFAPAPMARTSSTRRAAATTSHAQEMHRRFENRPLAVALDPAAKPAQDLNTQGRIMPRGSMPVGYGEQRPIDTAALDGM